MPCLVGWTLREIWGSQLTWGPNQAGERAGPKTALGELPLLGPLGAPLHPRLQAAGQLPNESGSCSLFQRTDTQHHLVTAENGGGELPPARSPQRGAHCRGSGRQGWVVGTAAPELGGVLAGEAEAWPRETWISSVLLTATRCHLVFGLSGMGTRQGLVGSSV